MSLNQPIVAMHLAAVPDPFGDIDFTASIDESIQEQIAAVPNVPSKTTADPSNAISVCLSKIDVVNSLVHAVIKESEHQVLGHKPTSVIAHDVILGVDCASPQFGLLGGFWGKNRLRSKHPPYHQSLWRSRRGKAIPLAQ